MRMFPLVAMLVLAVAFGWVLGRASLRCPSADEQTEAMAKQLRETEAALDLCRKQVKGVNDADDHVPVGVRGERVGAAEHVGEGEPERVGVAFVCCGADPVPGYSPVGALTAAEHEIDDDGHCWCQPDLEVVQRYDGEEALVVAHRRADC